MDVDKICLSSKTIEIAENETYLELTNRVCFYDEPNLNNAMLPFKGAEEKAKTLVNMPVVARYRVNDKGEPTFGSHEMYVDEDGDVAFATDNIGTHVEIYIKEDVVDVNGVLKTLPCLFAKYRVWKRNKNVIAAIRRLYSEGKLYSSWEIATTAYEFKDGIRTITDYTFLSNCLLGYEYASPAYGKDAKAVSLSSQDSQLLVAEALSQDIIESLNIETEERKENSLSKNKKTEVSEESTAVENTENNETNTQTEDVKNKDQVESSSLTEWDLRNKISEACKEKLGTWCWVAFHFPIEKKVWVEKEGRESELDYVQFTYEVNESDEVAVSEPEDVKLTVNVSELNTTIENLNSEISEKTDAIVKANEEVQTLKTQISELTPFKEKFEKVEQEKIDAETKEKKEKLVSKCLKSKFITKEEIEKSEDIKGFIENLDEKSIKDIIATRYMDSLEKTEVETSSADSKEKASPVVSTNLVGDDEEVDVKQYIKNFIRG